MKIAKSEEIDRKIKEIATAKEVRYIYFVSIVFYSFAGQGSVT